MTAQPKTCLEIRIACSPNEKEPLSEWLSRAVGKPVAEERTSNRTVLTVYLDDLDDTSLCLLREGIASLGGRILSEESLTDRDWEALWKRQGFQRFLVNGWLSVVPDWDKEPVLAGPAIRIHPHLAFGTGHHETTGRCLSLIVDHMPTPRSAGRAVLDFGSGTGILGIAALILGHGDQLYSVDDDPLAREATEANLVRNGCFGQATVLSGIDALFDAVKREKPFFSMVVANVTGGVITRLFPEWWGLLLDGGKMILSGISSGELDRVTSLCPGPFAVYRGRKFHTVFLRKTGATP